MTNGPDVEQWLREVKAQPGSEGIGMVLVHDGVVRGTSRSGDPVRGMRLDVDRDRLAEVLADAASWPGILAVRAWVSEGDLTVSDDIMKVLVAGDIREHVFGALQRLVGLIKNEVVIETEVTEVRQE